VNLKFVKNFLHIKLKYNLHSIAFTQKNLVSCDIISIPQAFEAFFSIKMFVTSFFFYSFVNSFSTSTSEVTTFVMVCHICVHSYTRTEI
jgi:hypothetical protein